MKARAKCEVAIELGRDGVKRTMFTVEQAARQSGSAFLVQFTGLMTGPLVLSRHELKRLRAACDSVLSRSRGEHSLSEFRDSGERGVL